MKKQFKYILFTACATLALSSCDINDVKNYGEMSTATFPTSEGDAIALLSGVYENQSEILKYNPPIYIQSQIASDDCLGGGGSNDPAAQALDCLLNVGAGITNDAWAARYQGINRANTLITALQDEESALEPTFRKTLLGETLFLRAYFHYELASLFGNVPLMTESSGDLVTPGDVETLYGQILQDLRDAADMMPDQNNLTERIGRIDKYGVEAMLARVWLFYTGMYCNGSNLADLVSPNYSPLTSVALPDGTTLTKEDVKKYIDDCYRNSGYSLVPDFRNLWAYTNRCTVEDYSYTKGQGLKWVDDDNNGTNTNPESMFAVKFNSLATWDMIGYNNELCVFTGVRAANLSQVFPFGNGWGWAPISANLYSEWAAAEPNDIRRDASIVKWDEYVPGFDHGADNWTQMTNFGNKKYSPVTANNPDGGIFQSFGYAMYNDKSQWKGGYDAFPFGMVQDIVIMRYADVCLMHSELWETAEGMNKVRERAGLPSVGYSLQALQNERRWELAGEFTRWNDIRRWHIAGEALDKQLGTQIWVMGEETRNSPQNGGYSARYNATAGFCFVPEQVISIGSMTQNPGWGGADGQYTGWH